MPAREKEKDKLIQPLDVLAGEVLPPVFTGKNPVNGQFLPGNRPVGRPKGARALLAEAFYRDVYKVWDRDGPDIIERVARESPTRFAAMVSSVLPKEISGPDGGPIEIGNGAVEALIRKLGALGEREIAYTERMALQKPED